MRDSSINTRIGKNLRAARHAAGLSQAALGDKIGVSFQQVQKYEKGVNRIDAPRRWIRFSPGWCADDDARQ